MGDGFCDKSCNSEECDFDGGDCVGKEAVDRLAVSEYDYSYYGL